MRMETQISFELKMSSRETIKSLENQILIPPINQENRNPGEPNSSNKNTPCGLVVSGLASYFTVAEYSLCIFIVKSMIAYKCPIEVSTAAGFVTGFFSVFIFAFLFGSFDQINTYAAQLVAKGDF